MSELTEQALEDALVEIMRYPEMSLKPTHLIIHPRYIGFFVAMQNREWKRSAYLRRRRGWAPK